MCLPFGASISCALFQEFSNALKHIVQFRLNILFVYPPEITNYLDDFFFIVITIGICNEAVQVFLHVCKQINCPISTKKTEWAMQLLVFLGVLLNGSSLVMAIPQEKKTKALYLLNLAIEKRKVTIHFIQKLTGTLNFLQKAIVPGRVFTRGMYGKLKLTDAKGKPLQQYHHVRLGKDFIMDCFMWKQFLVLANENPGLLCRPFIDFQETTQSAELLQFYSDASLNAELGFGGTFKNSWIVGKWNKSFIQDCKPSIEFLELFALTVSVLTWAEEKEMKDSQIIIHCDNEAVVYMVNKMASSCAQCMKLLRILTLSGLKHNRRLLARHVRTEMNILADALSRHDFKRFWRNAPESMKGEPDVIPPYIWLVEQIWNNEVN